jgi:hypothetical protein
MQNPGKEVIVLCNCRAPGADGLDTGKTGSDSARSMEGGGLGGVVRSVGNYVRGANGSLQAVRRGRWVAEGSFNCVLFDHNVQFHYSLIVGRTDCKPLAVSGTCSEISEISEIVRFHNTATENINESNSPAHLYGLPPLPFRYQAQKTRMTLYRPWMQSLAVDY